MINLDFQIRKISDCNYLLDENLNHSFISGNKVRKLKGILNNQLKEYKGILTIGSVYSSHCLATSFWGAKLGLQVILIIIEDKHIEVSNYPHLQMASEFGAQLYYTEESNAYQFIKKKKEEYANYLWVPGGGHTKNAAKEYENLMEEIFRTHNNLADEINNIILPLGTGTTALGLCNGLKKNVNVSDITVWGVSVARSEDRCREALNELSKDSLDNLMINTDYAGRYSVRTEETEQARKRFFYETGVLVDPIYNAKSLEVYYRKQLENTLVINTGGMLNNLL